MRALPDPVPATQEDFEALYGHPPSRTFQGFTVRLEGAPALVCGLYRDEDHLVAFSRIRDGTPKWAIVKAVRRLLELMRSKPGIDIYAIREAAIPTSGTLLTHMGFRHVGDGPDGGIYQWRM